MCDPLLPPHGYVQVLQLILYVLGLTPLAVCWYYLLAVMCSALLPVAIQAYYFLAIICVKMCHNPQTSCP